MYIDEETGSVAKANIEDVENWSSSQRRFVSPETELVYKGSSDPGE